jgi:hypothetical protein
MLFQAALPGVAHPVSITTKPIKTAIENLLIIRHSCKPRERLSSVRPFALRLCDRVFDAFSHQIHSKTTRRLAALSTLTVLCLVLPS